MCVLVVSFYKFTGDNDFMNDDWNHTQHIGATVKWEKCKLQNPTNSWYHLAFQKIFQHHSMRIHFLKKITSCTWCVINLYEFHYIRWANTYRHIGSFLARKTPRCPILFFWHITSNCNTNVTWHLFVSMDTRHTFT